MKDNVTNAINKFGITIAGMIGVALSGEMSQITAMLGGIIGSVIGNKITVTELIDSVKAKSPNKLNHDIIKVAKSAAKLAFNVVIGLYQQQVIEKEKNKFSKDDYKKLEVKFKEIVDNLRNYIADEKWINNLTSADIINYDNEFNKEKSLFNDAFSKELEDVNNIFGQNPFPEFYKNNFQKYFQLYFGEHLKQDKYRSALIAYQRETQKMIMDSINELRETQKMTMDSIDELKIKSDKKYIISAIKEGIEQHIRELPDVAHSEKVQAEIEKAVKELNNYFAAKKIIIKEIKSDKLLIEIPNKSITDTEKNYNQLIELTKDIYFFEYNNRLYSIDELDDEEAFDYITGKIKYNQIFTKQIIEAIKDECSKQYPDFYHLIEQKPSDWDTKVGFCDDGKLIISNNFIGIIGKQLDKLFAIGKDIDESEEVTRKKYIKKCNYIVRRTLDLVIFSFLSQLWDDVCNKKITLSAENSLNGYFTMNMNRNEQFVLLRRLINIYKEHKSDNPLLLIPEILKISDYFNENGKLHFCCIELEKLAIDTPNPNILDCHDAEKKLTDFLKCFNFLVNYKAVSMKKIEYLNIKKIEDGYLHHYVNLGYNQNSAEVEKRNFDNNHEVVKSLFTNAVLLYKGKNYTNNINLFPFVIDYNALTFEQNSKIAFFLHPSLLDKDSLVYSFLEDIKDGSFELKYKDIVEKRGGKNVVYLTNDDMKIYNIDCVITTLRMIQKALFN
jgi:hypothetical protein